MSKKSGRPTIDDRGNSHWEWLTDSGSYKSDIDTKRFKSLTDAQLSVTDKLRMPTGGFNPYDSAGQDPKKKSDSKPRKSLDDLRKLSEHIKNVKSWKNDKG